MGGPARPLYRPRTTRGPRRRRAPPAAEPGRDAQHAARPAPAFTVANHFALRLTNTTTRSASCCAATTRSCWRTPCSTPPGPAPGHSRIICAPRAIRAVTWSRRGGRSTTPSAPCCRRPGPPSSPTSRTTPTWCAPRRAVAQQLQAGPRTQAVLPYEPYYKLKPSLLNLAVAQKPLPANSALNVLLFADARAGDPRGPAKPGRQIVAAEEPFAVWAGACARAAAGGRACPPSPGCPGSRRWNWRWRARPRTI